MKLALGAPGLDAAMGGGLEPGPMTFIYGEGGTGKTTMCLHWCKAAIDAGGKVAFIDTESVSVERLDQIAHGKGMDIAKNILFFEVFDFDQQEEAVEKVVRLVELESRIRMIAVDSLTAFYRLTLGSDREADCRARLASQLMRLVGTARRREVHLVATGQVYRDSDVGEDRPIGGHMVSQNAKAIYRLDRLDVGERTLTVVKHRARPEGANVRYRLGPHGVEDFPAPIFRP